MATFGLTRLGGALAAVILVGIGPVRAAEPPAGSQACSQELDALSGQWNAIGLPPPEKPGQPRVNGRGGHSHTAGEVNFMRNQIGRAARLCKDGNEHEAMLRMDVVRAILKLAEVQHPAAHNYVIPNH